MRQKKTGCISFAKNTKMTLILLSRKSTLIIEYVPSSRDQTLYATLPLGSSDLGCDFISHTWLYSQSNIFSQVKRKNTLVVNLLDYMFRTNMEANEQTDLIGLLSELAALTHIDHSRVAIHARQMLIKLSLPSFSRRKADLERIFTATFEDSFESTTHPLQAIVDSQTAVFDVLSEFLYVYRSL